MSHQPHDIFENRKQFQLERLILFSDAVFAIAITLLVIEIRVPDIHSSGNSTQDLIDALLEKIPEFFGFVLSFAVIGQFWTNHHRLFGLVNNYNGGLLWLNLLMLFWIVLVPFTSGLNSRYGGLHFVWQIYSVNLFMIGLSLFFLYRYIGNPKNKLSELADDKLGKKYSSYRSLATTFIFLSSAVIAAFDGDFALNSARYILFLIPITIWLISKRHRSLHKKQTEKK